MKRYLAILVAVCFVLVAAAVAMAGSAPGSRIDGTLHDLSSTGPGGLAIGATETRICVYCHTPHFAAKASDFTGNNANIKYFPLWNHTLSVASYQTYTNGTELPNSIQHQLNADLSAGPGGPSRLCLSCHDGSIAINSYGTFQGNPDPRGGGATMPAGYAIGAGGDLSNHHPIGFDYAAVIAAGDDEINDPSNPFLNQSHGLTINDVLWNGKMECTSCHDVHNTKNDGTKFLWVDDLNQSDLCRSCHLK